PGEDQRRYRHSMRDLAAKMNVDEKNIRTAVYKDSRSKSYVIKVRQMLFEVSKAKIGSRTLCHVL
ncbi:Hypothetical protein FKW44_002350, partial [Caligus rogercresseyi]